MKQKTFTVLIYYPGHGRYQGGNYLSIQRFRDEKKARDYYADMLLRFPKYNVEFIED